jgi:hypothetical protein
MVLPPLSRELFERLFGRDANPRSYGKTLGV